MNKMNVIKPHVSAAVRRMLLASVCAVAVVPTVGVYAKSPAAVKGVQGEQADVGNTQTITVKGIRAGTQVKVYQIADGYYNTDKKLVRYVMMDPTNAYIHGLDTNSDTNTSLDEHGQKEGYNDIISETEITNIANNIDNGTYTADANPVTMSISTDTYKDVASGENYYTATANVEPGMYIIKATDQNGVVVYNPAVISVNVSDVNAPAYKAGTVDMTHFFESYDDKTVYLKSSESTADKSIVKTNKPVARAQEDKVQDYSPENKNGDTVAIGDTVYFRLDKMTIPSYTSDYKQPVTYNITDTVDTSFDKYKDFKLTVGNVEIKPSDTVADIAKKVSGMSLTSSIDVDKDHATDADNHAPGTVKIDETKKCYTLEDVGNSGFKVTFSEDYLRAVRGLTNDQRAVVITYDAVLNRTATQNFAENHNRVHIEYTDSATGGETPNDPQKTHKIDKDNYVYTFGIDANIDSENTDVTVNKRTTYEFNKVTRKHDSKSTEWTTQQKSNAPLKGATFTLYRDEGFTTKAATVNNPDATAVSDADGHITFTGLDEGTYYLKETKAPVGYTMTDALYRFTINANLNADGTLSTYSVNIKYKNYAHDTWTDAGTATYSAIGNPTITSTGDVNTNIDIKDNAVAIVNHKLQIIPSTGGKGAIGLAAGAGCGAIIAFAVVAKRRRKDEEAEEQ